MRYLENRIPPPLVAAVFAGLMWLYAQPDWSASLPAPWHIGIVLVVLLLGAAVCLAGLLSFRRARTIVNLLKPDTASALVSSGIYRYTRNPMYLGFAIALLAWAILLAAPLTLMGVAGFVLYIDRFQITPEERALAALFGEDFASYRDRTRRWI